MSSKHRLPTGASQQVARGEMVQSVARRAGAAIHRGAEFADENATQRKVARTLHQPRSALPKKKLRTD